MADRLQVRGLRAHALLGVGAEERRAPQPVLVDLVLELDLEPAGSSDRIEETVHYGELCRSLLAHVEATSFHLIEALARSVCRFLLDRYPRLHAVTVRVEKPAAVRGAAAVSAEVRRGRATSGGSAGSASGAGA